jgi:hypothetical protein
MMHDPNNQYGDQDLILKVLNQFGARLSTTPWFKTLGEPLSEPVLSLAEGFTGALGFPDAVPALVPDWSEAAEAAEALDWNNPSWEAEEALRADLTVRATDLMGEEHLEIAMMSLQELASPIIETHIKDAALHLGIHDENFTRAAHGAAIRGLYLAALVLIVGESEDHPLSLKYQLFEKGRWPLDIFGQSFNIF